MNRFLTSLILVILTACGPIKHLPPAENNHSVSVRDSVVVRDSLVIKTKSVYADYAGLLDTLRIDDERASMMAWADTSHNIIAGRLEVKPSENKTKYIYKDREVHDTLRIKEPFPVPVEVKTTPKAYPWSLAFNVLALVVAGLWLYFKGKLKFRI